MFTTVFIQNTHSCSKDTAQVSPTYLAVLECTTSTATHINTKDGYTASDPEVVATDNAVGHVRDVVIERKTSSGIFSLPDNAQGSSIARRKPRFFPRI